MRNEQRRGRTYHTDPEARYTVSLSCARSVCSHHFSSTCCVPGTGPSTLPALSTTSQPPYEVSMGISSVLQMRKLTLSEVNSKVTASVLWSQGFGPKGLKRYSNFWMCPFIRQINKAYCALSLIPPNIRHKNMFSTLRKLTIHRGSQESRA